VTVLYTICAEKQYFIDYDHLPPETKNLLKPPDMMTLHEGDIIMPFLQTYSYQVNKILKMMEGDVSYSIDLLPYCENSKRVWNDRFEFVGKRHKNRI